jgi:hypothetical protein
MGPSLSSPEHDFAVGDAWRVTWPGIMTNSVSSRDENADRGSIKCREIFGPRAGISKIANAWSIG